WSKRFGDNAYQVPNAITADAASNVVITGSCRGTVDFGGVPLPCDPLESDIFVAKFDSAGNHLWSYRYGGAGFDSGVGLAIDGMNGVVLTGETNGTVDLGGGPLTSSGDFDILVAKF